MGSRRAFSDQIRNPICETGLKFGDVYDLAVKYHEPIADAFGSDAGMELMNLDAAIALDVLYHFCSAGAPYLSVHDFFLFQRVLRTNSVV